MSATAYPNGFGEGIWNPMEVTERTTVMLWIQAHSTGSPGAELEAVLRVPADVVSRRRAELAAKIRGVKLEPVDGYDWTRERIDAWIAGVSHGKASAPALTQPEGPELLVADWPDGDWRAWRQHPQRIDLWREDLPVAEATPAGPPPATTSPGSASSSSSSSPPASSAGTSPPSSSRSSPSPGPMNGSASSTRAAPASSSTGPASTLPAGPRPTAEEWKHAKTSRAAAATACALCPGQVKYEDLVLTIGHWVAHFHCARQGQAGARLPASTGPVGPGARVRELRKAQKVTQEDLAKALGCKPAHVSACELGKEEFTPEELGQAATRLGVLASTLHVAPGPEGEEPLTPIPARMFEGVDNDEDEQPAEQDDGHGH